MSKLLETLLRSEFKFGFELEAYVSNWSEYAEYNGEYAYDDETGEYVEDDDYQYSDEDIDYDTLYEELSALFSKTFGDDVEVEGDGSLGMGGFEFPTPPMTLTPINIKKCIEFLYNLPNNRFGIYTDESCGFHTHISFPKMSKEDMVWIICHIALDPKLQDELISFKTSTGDEFDFFGKWATTDFLQDIESAIKTHDWAELSKWLSNEKYRVIRIHPQGTIEWRGPRNFLNKHNLNTIKEFFVKLSNLVLKIAKIIDTKEIDGISRQNFFKLINLDNLIQYRKRKSVNDSAIEAIVKNPLILTKINYNTDWSININKIEDKLKESNTSFTNFLVPLRYKEFKDVDILYYIIKKEPSFINFINVDNAKLFRKMESLNYFTLDLLLNVNNFSDDVVVNYLKYCTHKYFNDFLNGIKHRWQANKNINMFFTQDVARELKNRFNIDHMKQVINTDSQFSKEIKEKLFKLIA